MVVWEGVGTREGVVEPSWGWEAHGSAVGATAMHMSGSVVATCSGAWEIVDEDESDSDSDDSDDSDDSEEESGSEVSAAARSSVRSRVVVPETSLKVWSLGPSNPPEDERGSPAGGEPES